MSTDLSFFESRAPVVLDLYSVFVAVGWAMLLGNLVFQALKGMMAGLGFEAESPVSLLARTTVYGLLLLGSKQICELGLGVGGDIINLIGIPAAVQLTPPDAGLFSGAGDASWILVIIVGFVLGFQLLKLFFEIGERYVVVCILTLLAPLGFAMGGSKSTKEIATGYIRMFASMLIMMILNVLFLRVILDVLGYMPSAATVIPWCILVVALVRTARKVDNMISKIGLNPAITGDPLSHKGSPMALMLLAARAVARNAAAKAGSKSAGGSKKGGGGKTYSCAKSMNKSGSNNTSAKNSGGNSSSTNTGTNQQNGSQSSTNNSRFGSTQNVQNSQNQSAGNSSQSAGGNAVSVNKSNANSTNQAENGKNASTGGIKPSSGKQQSGMGNKAKNKNAMPGNGQKGAGFKNSNPNPKTSLPKPGGASTVNAPVNINGKNSTNLAEMSLGNSGNSLTNEQNNLPFSNPGTQINANRFSGSVQNSANMSEASANMAKNPSANANQSGGGNMAENSPKSNASDIAQRMRSASNGKNMAENKKSGNSHNTGTAGNTQTATGNAQTNKNGKNISATEAVKGKNYGNNQKPGNSLYSPQNTVATENGKKVPPYTSAGEPTQHAGGRFGSQPKGTHHAPVNNIQTSASTNGKNAPIKPASSFTQEQKLPPIGKNPVSPSKNINKGGGVDDK